MPTQDSSSPARNGAPLFEPSRGVSSRRDIARFLFRHFRLLFGIVAGVTALAGALVYLLPQSYASTSLVLVERSKSPTLRSEVLGYAVEIDEVVNAEIEIVQSRTVAEGVVDRLGLDRRPRRETWIRRLSDRVEDELDRLGLVVKLDRRGKLVRGIPRTLKVRQTPRSNVFSITFYADEPGYVMEVARAITDVYLERHQSVFIDNTVAFYDARLKETEAELKQLRESIQRETERSRLDALQLQVEGLDRAYLLYREKRDRARGDQAGDPSLVNLRVIDYPDFPLRPRFSRLLLILLAFAGSCLLAISSGLFRDYFDHTVYSPRELTAHLNVPMLGSVRRVRASTLRRIARRRV